MDARTPVLILGVPCFLFAAPFSPLVARPIAWQDTANAASDLRRCKLPVKEPAMPKGYSSTQIALH
ncbi:MAG: hypothetical protein ACK5PT_01830, partial [Cereibacter sp.]